MFYDSENQLSKIRISFGLVDTVGSVSVSSEQ